MDHFRNALETSRSSSPLDFGALTLHQATFLTRSTKTWQKKKNANKKNVPIGEKIWIKPYKKPYKNVSKCWVLRFWDTKNKHGWNFPHLGLHGFCSCKVHSPAFPGLGVQKNVASGLKKGRSMAIRIIKTDEIMGKICKMMDQDEFLNDEWRRMSEKWQLMNDDRWQYWVMNDDGWRMTDDGVYDDCL